MQRFERVSVSSIQIQRLVSYQLDDPGVVESSRFSLARATDRTTFHNKRAHCSGALPAAGRLERIPARLP
jgi:hypothetical protein